MLFFEPVQRGPRKLANSAIHQHPPTVTPFRTILVLGRVSNLPTVCDRFSVEWTGTISTTQGVDGTYLFSTVSEGGVRLWISDTLIIDNWTSHPLSTDTGSITLTGGQ